MFAIPPFILLVPYALIALGAAFLSLFNIINLLKYGARNGVGFAATFIYICGAAIILFFTWQFLPEVEWRQPLQVLGTAAQAL